MPQVVITAVAPDDGCKHTKHEELPQKNNKPNTVASCGTIKKNKQKRFINLPNKEADFIGLEWPKYNYMCSS